MLAGGAYAPVTPLPRRRRVDEGAVTPEQEQLLRSARKLVLAHETGDELDVRFGLDGLTNALITLDEAAAASPLT